MADANEKPKARIAKRFVAPIAATAASAAASYLAKKAPAFFETTVLPKLREATRGAGSAAEKLPERAKTAAGSAASVAEELTDRARAFVGDGNGDDSRASRRNGFSPEELERRHAERAVAREARRKASKA